MDTGRGDPGVFRGDADGSSSSRGCTTSAVSKGNGNGITYGDVRELVFCEDSGALDMLSFANSVLRMAVVSSLEICGFSTKICNLGMASGMASLANSRRS